MIDYSTFLNRKAQVGTAVGFEPLWLPDFLKDFQRSLTGWAIRRGRAEIGADCGLGKTPMSLVWCENMIRQTNKPSLILAPLAVSHQFVREGEKFGIDCKRSGDGKLPPNANVVVTNYERLHLFDRDDFGSVACDEAGAIKDFDGKRTAEVTEFMRTFRYRLLCSATPAPNDYVELGTSAEALGEMGFSDMVTRFFRKQTSKDHLGWGRTKYQLRPHAERDFWRWVCSWMRAVRKPSDLGFEDGDFVLPPLTVREHQVKAKTPRPGQLFDTPATTMQEQREERRRTLTDRCEKAAELATHDRPAICWCGLNDEGDLLEKLLPDSVQVSGSDSDDEKEEKLMAFVNRQARVLVSKPRVAGFGLNLQHCAHETFFPSDSFEEWYQAIRRCWRFGQTSEVTADIVTTEGGAGTLANLQRKSAKAEALFANLVELMNDSLKIDRTVYGTMRQTLPAWMGLMSA